MVSGVGQRQLSLECKFQFIDHVRKKGDCYPMGNLLDFLSVIVVTLFVISLCFRVLENVRGSFIAESWRILEMKFLTFKRMCSVGVQ